MDYVYIYREGLGDELRYSIRSLAKNAPEGRVWLVGGKPDWYNGDHISVKAVGGKFKNISECYWVIARCDEISEDYILMNDDFFILEKISQIPVLHGGLLSTKVTEYIRMLGPTMYSTILGKAMHYLRAKKINEPLDYDIHVPMQINRKKFLELVPRDTQAPRSMYGNLANIGGVKIQDVKTYNKAQYKSRSYEYSKDNSPYVSTDDDTFEELYNQTLKDMFPEPSKYEYPRQDSNLRHMG